MGLFFERQPQPVVRGAILDALEAQPDAGSIDNEANRRADTVTAQLGENKTFHRGRFVIAVVILVVLIAIAITTEASGLTESSKALWGLTTTIFGVVAGFLGGEATS